MAQQPRNSFTIEELIAELQDIQRTAGPKAMVYFQYDYGDHWHTPVAAEVQLVEQGEVVFSEYHCMNKVLEEGAQDGGDSLACVLLRSK